MSSVVLGLFAGWAGTSITRAEVTEKLRLARESCKISINGKPAQNTKEILRVLKAMYWSPGHHSHPTTAINPKNAVDVDVSYDSEHVMLRLARDSDDPKEYWVFFPKYRITATNEIGRMKTSAFDTY